MSTEIHSHPWGSTPDGQPVLLYTLSRAGLEVAITTFGATLVSVRTPDRNGILDHILLGADTLDAYLKHPDPYLGATIGRFCNRIAHGRFALDGVEYQVPLNNGSNALHGGTSGFDRRVWSSAAIRDGIRLTYISPDGEMGFPGELTTHVDYTLGANSLHIAYTATTTQPTILNLTSHAYWNLNRAAANMGDHHIQIMADRLTPIDATLIPTGELMPVAGTPFDLRQPVSVRTNWDSADEQIQLAGGFDHNFVLDTSVPRSSQPHRDERAAAAIVSEPSTGRTLTLSTSQPAVQFYSGNFLDGTFPGRSGRLARRSGLCLEPQHFPDSPNHSNFPSTILRPGETFRASTLLTFGLTDGAE